MSRRTIPRRISATLLLSLLIGFTAIDARARTTEITVDGCAMLARAIYSEVSSAAIYGTGSAGPWLIDQERGDIVSCMSVAKTVSQAFTSAMLSAGIDINWQRSRDDGSHSRRDYCLSAFLSGCYPDQLPPSTNRVTASVVQNSWAVVKQAVMREMYNPISSNEVSFRSNDLKLRLGLSLRSIDGLDANRRRLPSRQ
jgi:hypothetical protein